jgi:hypothetical protein
MNADKHRLKANVLSVFIRVHLWPKLSFRLPVRRNEPNFAWPQAPVASVSVQQRQNEPNLAVPGPRSPRKCSVLQNEANSPSPGSPGRLRGRLAPPQPNEPNPARPPRPTPLSAQSKKPIGRGLGLPLD